MNWPNDFDGAHTVTKKEEPDLTLAYMVGAANAREAADRRLDAIAERIEAFARSQTTYPLEAVAMQCAEIVRGKQ